MKRNSFEQGVGRVSLVSSQRKNSGKEVQKAERREKLEKGFYVVENIIKIKYNTNKGFNQTKLPMVTVTL